MDSSSVELFYFDLDNSQPFSDRIEAFKKEGGMDDVLEPWSYQFYDFPLVDRIDHYVSQLIELPDGTSMEEARKHIVMLDLEYPWCPADPPHMLAFGTSHADRFTRNLTHIVGLGSHASKGSNIQRVLKMPANVTLQCMVPHAIEWKDHWRDFDGGEQVRFLAVRILR